MGAGARGDLPDRFVILLDKGDFFLFFFFEAGVVGCRLPSAKWIPTAGTEGVAVEEAEGLAEEEKEVVVVVGAFDVVNRKAVFVDPAVAGSPPEGIAGAAGWAGAGAGAANEVDISAND